MKYQKPEHVVIIGSGVGGRANIFQAEGFTLDMGPSCFFIPVDFL